MKKAILLLAFAALQCSINAQSKTLNDPKMDWWKEARFGMFIHWGLYAVPAGTYDGKQIPGIGEWIMNRGKIPMSVYQTYPARFNPVKFNADAWVKLASEAGMKYLVITSKHHDGFAMFHSKDPFNIIDATPFKRDPIKELAEACKKYKIRFGLYYSQAQDWNHPGGAANGGYWDSAQKGNMDKYIDEVAVPQVKEILDAYNPAIIWWDTPTNMNPERATKLADLLKNRPDIITNNRLGGGYEGDLETPEQYIPATGIPGKNWESCMTMNDTWGFKSYDQNWKSTKVLIRNLIDIASKGGNYLLNVGPTEEGIIPEPSVERLKQVGAWLKPNADAIYGSKASPFTYLRWGRATQKNNKLFLHVFEWPADGKLKIPMNNAIAKAQLLTDKKAKIGISRDGLYAVLQLPKTAPDTIATVIALDINGPVQLSITEPIPSTGKTATASSQDSDKFSPANVLDGEGKTVWKAAADQKTAWLQIDLGKSYSIGAMAVAEAGGNIQQYKLEYQSGTEWKTLVEGKGLGSSAFKTFDPVKAQVFRLSILQAKAAPQIKDLQLLFEE